MKACLEGIRGAPRAAVNQFASAFLPLPGVCAVDSGAPKEVQWIQAPAGIYHPISPILGRVTGQSTWALAHSVLPKYCLNSSKGQCRTQQHWLPSSVRLRQWPARVVLQDFRALGCAERLGSLLSRSSDEDVGSDRSTYICSR